jgi:hypothetical protein
MTSCKLPHILNFSHHCSRASAELDVPVGGSQQDDVSKCPVFPQGILYDFAFSRSFERKEQHALQ